MKSAVIIKGNKYGFQIVLNPDLSFDQLTSAVEARFQASGAFFDKNKPVAVSFSGRDLTEEEQDKLVDVMQGCSDLVVSYVIDGAQAHETRFAGALAQVKQDEEDKGQGRAPDQEQEDASSTAHPEWKETSPEGLGIISRILSGKSKVHSGKVEDTEVPEEVPEEKAEEGELTGPVFPEDKVGKSGQFYRGILRSGQKIEVDGSFVILGDVNPGAQIIAGGNVVVLGSLKGTVYAGYPQDRSAIVAALNMEPMQIQIGDFIARSADAERKKPGRKQIKRKKQPDMEPRMAFVDEGNICIEKIDRTLIGEISSRK